MRKIEALMVVAVHEAINGSEKQFRCANTRVYVEHVGIRGTAGYVRDVVVELHGYRIAVFDSALNGARECRGLRVSHCGWETRTTKSRLNALLGCFYGGQALRSVKGQWLLNSTEFLGTDWVSYGWQDNWMCQQAEKLSEPRQRRCESVYDAEWHKAMAERLALAKGQQQGFFASV